MPDTNRSMQPAVEPQVRAPAAFDALAPNYDQVFSTSPIAQFLRAKTHQRLAALTQAGSSALELGCGTGEDALFLARCGVHIVATDASDQMLRRAEEKLRDQPRVSFVQLDIHEPPDLGRTFSLAFGNFGVLNCTQDRTSFAAWLAKTVERGGTAAFAVMSPFCLWEIVWHGVHGELGVAARRWRSSTRFETASGAVQIAYPSIQRLTREFAPYFRRTFVMPLGLFLPPSDVYGAVESRPRVSAHLMRLEKRFGGLSPLALFADHYWIEFTRSGED